jgi:hypothetical protein
MLIPGPGEKNFLGRLALGSVKAASRIRAREGLALTGSANPPLRSGVLGAGGACQFAGLVWEVGVFKNSSLY